MPVHPRLKPVLAIANRAGDDDLTMPARREASSRQARQLGRLVMRAGPKVPTRELMVPVDGGAIRIRLYEPPDRPRPSPLHVFLHGGGWCVGDLDQRDPRCRTVAAGARCVVASVDYRMAPENAYPVPVDDCHAALCWLVEQAAALGVDPDRVSVGGESAGGNLAALVCLRARDGGPPIRFQWLDVPATDLTMSQPSVARFATGYGLTRQDMERYVAAYLRDHDRKDPEVSPLFAGDLAGLPPALVTTVEFDPLHDEGAAYAARLGEAGVAVEHHDLPGLVHAAFAFTRLLPEARAHEHSAIAALSRALHA
jgi:acetyl esterase